MTVQMDLAKMEELVKIKLMTMFVIVVVGIMEKIVKVCNKFDLSLYLSQSLFVSPLLLP